MREPDNEFAEGKRQDAPVAVVMGRKVYYSITDVCAMTGIKPHILRYWEKEFSLLHPKKNSGGKRVYKEKDIEAIGRIKRMLEEEKYTLQGAKEKLFEERRALRATGNATAEKRGKAAAAEWEDDMDTAESAASIPAGTGRELTTGKSMPRNNNGDRADNALILGIREELLEVLGLLEA
jgi:DNA-binding transcriptional MerR regulator